MNYTIAAKDSTTHLTIEGTLDAVSVSDLRGELDKLVGARPKAVEVDLSQLRMIDSSGVGALVSLYKRVRAQGGNVDPQGRSRSAAGDLPAAPAGSLHAATRQEHRRRRGPSDDGFVTLVCLQICHASHPYCDGLKLCSPVV